MPNGDRDPLDAVPFVLSNRARALLLAVHHHPPASITKKESNILSGRFKPPVPCWNAMCP
jgi:hypothetical protein